MACGCCHFASYAGQQILQQDVLDGRAVLALQAHHDRLLTAGDVNGGLGIPVVKRKISNTEEEKKRRKTWFIPLLCRLSSPVCPAVVLVVDPVGELRMDVPPAGAGQRLRRPGACRGPASCAAAGGGPVAHCQRQRLPAQVPFVPPVGGIREGGVRRVRRRLGRAVAPAQASGVLSRLHPRDGPILVVAARQGGSREKG